MPVSKRRLEERSNSSNEMPDGLKPYKFHGLVVEYSKRDTECVTECPFCGKHKFSINVNTGQWRCFVCGGGTDKGGGGLFDFLQLLWQASDQATTDYREMQEMKGIQYPESLMYWGVARSITSGHWVIPAYNIVNHEIKLRQLYRYTKIKAGEEYKQVLLPTPLPNTGKPKHGIFGLQNFERGKDEIYICEGPWDGIRLWEVMRTTAMKDEEGTKFEDTGSLERSLYHNANVISMPGCNAFVPTIKELCKSKTVYLCYDNDYPQVNPKTNVRSTPAGYMGAKRAASHLTETTDSILYLRWGEQGYDADLPDGFDVRDILAEDKIEGITNIYDRMMEVPDEWTDETAAKQLTSVQPIPCNDWETLSNAWRKALKWTEGLDRALCAMLASVASTNSIGDQLWLKVIGPPSCGKSTLSEAISVNRHYVIAKSSIRGFHSGYKDKDEKKDNSLIPLIMGKTFILKDGDTLLQSPGLGQILAEARDLYDSVSRSHYKNNMGKDYEGVRMTWLLCGTSSLRALDNSELGQRFLDCVVMDRIDSELEDDILWRQVNRAAEHVDIEVDPEDKTTNYSPELLEAMQLTGGYVTWLRENAYQKLRYIKFSEQAKRQCMYLGKFVSYMRSRPSSHQKEEATRELAARLVSQHTRLAKCTALVLNCDSVNEEVMRRVRQVALDTSRGIVLKIAQHLHSNYNTGASFKAIHLRLNCTEGELRTLLRFLREIGMVKYVKLNRQNVWMLTEELQALCSKVLTP